MPDAWGWRVGPEGGVSLGPACSVLVVQLPSWVMCRNYDCRRCWEEGWSPCWGSGNGALLGCKQAFAGSEQRTTGFCLWNASAMANPLRVIFRAQLGTPHTARTLKKSLWTTLKGSRALQPMTCVCVCLNECIF